MASAPIPLTRLLRYRIALDRIVLEMYKSIGDSDDIDQRPFPLEGRER
jgi:hypothetical protein